MYDVLNIQTVDEEALAEIEMTTNLIIAASTSNERLTQEAINQALGIPAAPGHRPRAAGSLTR
jgi:hypothetical protein